LILLKIHAGGAYATGALPERFFHRPERPEALWRTCGYNPRVFTTAAPGEVLRYGLVVCTIRSWIVGFSDTQPM
jgi:hypothetical protein